MLQSLLARDVLESRKRDRLTDLEAFSTNDAQNRRGQHAEQNRAASRVSTLLVIAALQIGAE